ncbi:MAG: 4-hydroxy-tetrahydrodipicolinate synthase [Bdellovibrionota bacterium]
MSHKPFSGVITALVTPFKKNLDLDLNAFSRLLENQKKSGIHGVVVLGTTGENPTLTEEESQKLVLTALEHRTENFHIYVGSGTNDTKHTIQKSLIYSKLQVGQNKPDGIMVVTPYYNKPNAQHLVYHYGEIFRAIKETPVCVYNVPGRTGININAQTLVKIAQENENLVAIKEAAGNVNAIVEMRLALNAAGKQHINILSGDDGTYAPSLLCGANGVISVTTNLIPKPMLDILYAVQNGNFAQAQALHLETFCINSGIFFLPNPVGIKWMLGHLGICEGFLRPPLYTPEEHEIQQLKFILSQLEKVPKICK